MRRVCWLALVGVAVAVVVESLAFAASPEDAWLRDLEADVRADIAAGKPVVVQVHVPLCDNSIIRCGGAGLGDGNDLRRNLYWATSEGLAGWMDRRDSGWSPELRTTGDAVGEPEVLQVRVWRRELDLPTAWRAPGMPQRFTVRVVGFAWRGTSIDRALSAYLSDLFRRRSRVIPLVDPGSGRRLDIEAGGAARLVAWAGHNRLMDIRANWAELVRTQDTGFRKGALAIACYSADYLRPALPGPSRVPLLMTASFVMASSAALEQGALAFLAGGDFAAIRAAGIAGYARGQRRPVDRVRNGFTNPSDRRWYEPRRG
jgi:hypothetical protein